MAVRVRSVHEVSLVAVRGDGREYHVARGCHGAAVRVMHSRRGPRLPTRGAVARDGPTLRPYDNWPGSSG